MRLSVALITVLCSWVMAQEVHPRIWQPGLPDDGVVSVSRIGQGKVTRQLFNECWAAFRTQYYVDADGAFKPHDRTLQTLRVVGRMDYAAYFDALDGLERYNPYRRRLQIVGNADAQGRPIDGYYLVQQGAPSTEEQIADRRFASEKRSTTGALRFYVADSSVARSGLIEVMVDASQPGYGSGRFLRELAPMPDSKALQDAFVESLKAGSVFKVVVPRYVVCPHDFGGVAYECKVCKSRGGREFPHLMTLKW